MVLRKKSSKAYGSVCYNNKVTVENILIFEDVEYESQIYNYKFV